jgi:hypothetical protein
MKLYQKNLKIFPSIFFLTMNEMKQEIAIIEKEVKNLLRKKNFNLTFLHNHIATALSTNQARDEILS